MSTNTPTPNISNKRIGQLELRLVSFSIVILLIILTPIFLNVKEFPFYFLNTIYVLAFITFSRYIFLLKYTFLANREILKIVLVFLCIPIVFLLVQELNLFQTFLDEEGLEAMVGTDLPLQQRTAISKYIHSEIMLFGVGSIISAVILPIRLVISIWRGRNNAGI